MIYYQSSPVWLTVGSPCYNNHPDNRPSWAGTTSVQSGMRPPCWAAGTTPPIMVGEGRGLSDGKTASCGRRAEGRKICEEKRALTKAARTPEAHVRLIIWNVRICSPWDVLCFFWDFMDGFRSTWVRALVPFNHTAIYCLLSRWLECVLACSLGSYQGNTGMRRKREAVKGSNESLRVSVGPLFFTCI